MGWGRLAEWWLEELRSDDSYESTITPLLFEVMQPKAGTLYLDLGSGDGRVLRSLGALGADAVGIELDPELAHVSESGSVVARLPEIPLRDDAVDGAYAVLVLEHLEDHARFFEEVARVTRGGGILALVMNHPVWTAPDSTPITDSDGEVLWRPGAYFSSGSSEIRAGEASVTFHHRTMSSLLNAAAGCRWHLEHLLERPHHESDERVGIPRLLACRWSLAGG